MPRLFTGLEIPADLGRRLSELRGGLPGARWVDPENYHITLRFIGDVDDGVARDLYAALSESRPREPIEVMLDRLDTFGGGKPRALPAPALATSHLGHPQGQAEHLIAP